MVRKIPTFLILLFSIFLYTAEVKAENKNEKDVTSDTICKIIKYIWTIGGPLMTVVIIGAALLAIFGRMPWPALVALGVFCAVFFGAATIVKQLVPQDNKFDIQNCG
ncbi:MAG: TrbC/VirB2 family protein [Wolbachia endosymbiont of Fragariocoptes setiger]|nr:TrbC/VirB2 family protein [Wolbachia endosymbiont of Fragariocoptes setiger]